MRARAHDGVGDDHQRQGENSASGCWRDREGWLRDFGQGSSGKSKFPERGDPQATPGRLRGVLCGGEMFEAVDDAEFDWRSY
jgi:hypothetical protein